jgi:hypothetical protein
MSMAGGNPALEIDVFANTSRLPSTLADAERQVTQATQRVGRSVDDGFSKIGNQITRRLSAAVGAGFAIKVVDDALRKVAEGLRESKGPKEIGEAIGNGIIESIKGIPIAGALMDIASQVSNAALRDPMGRDIAAAAYQDFQRNQAQLAKAAVDVEGELELQGADEESRARASRAREFFRLRELGERAKAGRTQMVDGVEQEIEPGVLARIRGLIDAGMRKYDEEVAAKNAQERARTEARFAAEQERRIKEQEDAYDRFIEGNRREAILALEAQLGQAEIAMEPTRQERLAGIMSGMGTGIGMGETALGAFTFAQGDAAEISRGILEKATSQLEALERIEAIQEQIRDLQRGGGLN